MALVFPTMMLFDLFINHRRINLSQISLLMLLSFSIVISYIGDKICGDDDLNDDELSLQLAKRKKRRSIN